MRAIWSGHITFGLISIPVGLYAAIESSERVSFRLLHRKDMAPIRYKKFCSEEDIEVPNDEIVKGYEVSKKKYAVVEPSEPSANPLTAATFTNGCSNAVAARFRCRSSHTVSIGTA
jgi:DNA end-binding protein Ku